MSNIPLGLFSDVFWWVSVHKAVGLSCLNHATMHETGKNCRESYIPPRPTCCFFRSFSFTRCLKAWISHQNLRFILFPFKLSVENQTSKNHSRQVWGFKFFCWGGFKFFRGRINHLTMIPRFIHGCFTKDITSQKVTDLLGASLQRDFRTCSTRLNEKKTMWIDPGDWS